MRNFSVFKSAPNALMLPSGNDNSSGIFDENSNSNLIQSMWFTVITEQSGNPAILY